ncbi:hypothetical protein [Oryza sativa Japonica Group]|uniref:Kinetochore protein SPC25 n=1 Tax=Oryza sativa subsp. japonica TaxID=39947 RepID=Q5JK71_ORYSJ|nr:hypothetical protein [Oryza sativa Japonica Group]
MAKGHTHTLHVSHVGVFEVQVVGGEGVKFIFSKIDIQNPDNEYSFCIKLNKVLECTPFLKDSEDLVKDLNCSNDLFMFVRIMRKRF